MPIIDSQRSERINTLLRSQGYPVPLGAKNVCIDTSQRGTFLNYEILNEDDPPYRKNVSVQLDAKDNTQLIPAVPIEKALELLAEPGESVIEGGR